MDFGVGITPRSDGDKQGLPIGTEPQRRRVVIVFGASVQYLKATPFLARRGVPEDDLTIVAATGECVAVRAERNRPDAAEVLRGDQLAIHAASHIPDAQLFVPVSHGQGGAVGRE